MASVYIRTRIRILLGINLLLPILLNGFVFVTVPNANGRKGIPQCYQRLDMSHSNLQQEMKSKTQSQTSPSKSYSYEYSIPLDTARPKPQSIMDTLTELWNDPRPITDIVQSKDRTMVGQLQSTSGDVQAIPYCIQSTEFLMDTESFQILLYPRGRVMSSPTTSSSDNVSGPASAYLRYLPSHYGDEVDLTWTLRLRDVRSNTTLPIETSGGFPKSNDTWVAAMTFCTDVEAVESVGRATDWGSSSWKAKDVCGALGHLVAEGEIRIFEKRVGESSFGLPPRGGVGAVLQRAQMASSMRSSSTGTRTRITTTGTMVTNTQSKASKRRDFRAGEVIVPTRRRKVDSMETWNQLQKLGIYPGVDYRIMTMAKNGSSKNQSIFSTSSLSNVEKDKVKLALRPCGWKLQRQLYKQSLGAKTVEWPVEVPHSLLEGVSTTRFNFDSALPRVVSAFQRDWVAYTVALALAISPIPFTLLARNFVSLYAIPSASMEPTLVKGDVLLVEKLPHVYKRTHRGDVILFNPPPTLRDIVTQSGSQLSSTSLFVKRVVGMPGDEDVHLKKEDNNVFINGELAVGPNRNMCTDEPLRLIDRLLENGKGKEIPKLGGNDLYVLGDCKAVSVDSRVFGTLPKDNVVGKPVARIWPLNRLQLDSKF